MDESYLDEFNMQRKAIVGVCTGGLATSVLTNVLRAGVKIVDGSLSRYLTSAESRSSVCLDSTA